MSTRVQTVVRMPTSDAALRRRYRAYVSAGRERGRKRLPRRAATALVTALGTAAALRFGMPKALRVVAAGRSASKDVIQKAGEKIVQDVAIRRHKGMARGIRRARVFLSALRSPRGSLFGRKASGKEVTRRALRHVASVKEAKRKLAIGALGFMGTEGAERAVKLAGRYPGRLGAGAGAAQLGAGGAVSYRRRRRKEERFARRLLLL